MAVKPHQAFFLAARTDRAAGLVPIPRRLPALLQSILSPPPPPHPKLAEGGGGRVRRAGPARVLLQGQRPPPHPPVEGRQRPPAQGAVPGKALFLPTQTTIRFNPLLRGFFERLVAAGKPKMQAVGACRRKLVMLCYGALKNRAPFDPEWASKKAP
jgi:hypothetical protein